MSSIFVTGGTGLTGANVCEQLIERGDDVRALVRNPDEAATLGALGVELVQGDIANADDVLSAAKGCEAAIHTAALLGGASQDIADFHAVNVVGTTNVLDAGRDPGHAASRRAEHRDVLRPEPAGARRGSTGTPTSARRPLHGHQAGGVSRGPGAGGGRR